MSKRHAASGFYVDLAGNSNGFKLLGHRKRNICTLNFGDGSLSSQNSCICLRSCTLTINRHMVIFQDGRSIAFRHRNKDMLRKLKASAHIQHINIIASIIYDLKNLTRNADISIPERIRVASQSIIIHLDTNSFVFFQTHCGPTNSAAACSQRKHQHKCAKH